MSHISHWGSADALDHAHITLQKMRTDLTAKRAVCPAGLRGVFEPACSIFAD